MLPRRLWTLTLAVVLLASAGAPADAATTRTVDLRNEFLQRVDGGHAGDQFGDRLANAGNRDGRGGDEIIAGAIFADVPKRDAAGVAYVFSPRRLLDLGSAGRRSRILRVPRMLRLDGSTRGESAGEHVGGVGDVNGDGVADVAYTEGVGVDSNVYLVLSTGGRTVIDSARRPKGVLRYPEATQPVAAGDFDGDGTDDMLDSIGAGYAEICFGGRSWTERTCAQRSLRVEGPDDSETTSSGPATGVGDINGDGLDDIALTLFRSVAVVFGRRNRSPTVDLTTPDFGGFIVGGAESPQRPHPTFGRSISPLGDVDGDGLDDLAIGAPAATVKGRPRAGEVSIVYGRRETAPVPYPVPADQGATILGASAGDRAGWQVARLGTERGGAARLVIGAFLAGGLGRVDAGVTYVVDVPRRNQPAPVDLRTPGAAATRIVGSSGQEQSGYRLDTADVDGDGRREVIVGAGFADHAGKNSGSLYVVRPSPDR